MRITIIDDDKVFTEPLVWCLEQEGWTVTLYGSVDEIFDENGNLNGGTTDCLILDVLMPWGMKYNAEETAKGRDTGLKVLERIMQIKPGLPVIIITVRADLHLFELKERFGEQVKAVLVKPVVPTKVLETLEQEFHGRYRAKVDSHNH